MIPIELVTTENVSGYRNLESLGVVIGTCVRSVHLGKDVLAGLKTFIGGDLRGYEEMLEESRAQAIQRMLSQAKELNADAIVSFRLTSSELAQGVAEVIAYGTAVRHELHAST